MSGVTDHPLRYQLANELHARPFPAISAPGRAVFLAIKRVDNAAARDRDADRAHLIALLDRFGAAHPQPGATHYSGMLGKHLLKWESHTEFVTYTLFADGVAERPFDAVTFSVFPTEWLESAPGTRITSALIRIETMDDDQPVAGKINDWFVPESIAVSRVLDDKLIVAGDFRIDPAGHMRFAVFARPDTGNRRIGRVVQRLCEIETYKTMSMLGLSRSRELQPRMTALNDRLSVLVSDMAEEHVDAEKTLQNLLSISSELEKLVTQNSFRFGATGAYERLVHQRVEVLREDRFEGRQTFSEFMMRRFDPAMRTVKSTERLLHGMSDRAIRAAELLRTRVDVERSAENQELLESMDRRSDLQLRLQRTVEGLSVVAISYYAVNLVLNLTGPIELVVGLGKPIMAAIVTPPVIVAVWWLILRIRKVAEGDAK